MYHKGRCPQGWWQLFVLWRGGGWGVCGKGPNMQHLGELWRLRSGKCGHIRGWFGGSLARWHTTDLEVGYVIDNMGERILEAWTAGQNHREKFFIAKLGRLLGKKLALNSKETEIISVTRGICIQNSVWSECLSLFSCRNKFAGTSSFWKGLKNTRMRWGTAEPCLWLERLCNQRIINLWNLLPEDIIEENRLARFRKGLDLTRIASAARLARIKNIWVISLPTSGYKMITSWGQKAMPPCYVAL